MKSYILSELNSKPKLKNYLITSLNYEGVLSYLLDIQSKLDKSDSGKLIIDQIITTGLGKNRFIECKYFNGEIDIKTAKLIEVPQRIKKLSSKNLRECPDVILFSILTDQDKQKILKGGFV